MPFGNHALFVNHPEMVQALSGHVIVRTFDKDAAVLHHGDPASHLWLVLKGWVKLTRQTPDGKESVTGLCTQGDVFGKAALFPHANYPYYAEVLTPQTELAAIPSDVIRGLVEENSALSASIMALLNARTSQARLKLEQLGTMSASQRLGCFLLHLCQHQASGSTRLEIPVEKHILAAYLGMKPETLSRSQQQLKPLGIAVSGHMVSIDAIEKLRMFVCNSCSESGSCDTEQPE
jgi:CRP-like cAMP-binding protein